MTLARLFFPLLPFQKKQKPTNADWLFKPRALLTSLVQKTPQQHFIFWKQAHTYPCPQLCCQIGKNAACGSLYPPLSLQPILGTQSFSVLSKGVITGCLQSSQCSVSIFALNSLPPPVSIPGGYNQAIRIPLGLLY